MRKDIIPVIGVACLFAVIGVGAWLLTGSAIDAAETMDPVTVAYSPFESTALFWIAEDMHFFARNGLNVTLRRYDSGAGSLDGLVNGEADIAVGVTEFPLVRKAFQGAHVRTLGTIDRGEFNYLVGRRDRGIVNITDLRGKRVGTTVGTIVEFHLGRFLLIHGLGMQDITLVDVRTPAGWVDAVADGEIDAIATAQPYVNAARDRLGTNAVSWSVQSSQPLFANVISTDDWISAHPRQAARFLKSLAEAEEYRTLHPAESRAIVQERLDLDPGYMDTVWQQNQFSLSLDQSLILAMEDEARWMIANNLTDARSIPDFRDYIDTQFLEEVKPGAVNIID
jgi:NitT/TauT family transport system substrate-binding protein